MKKTMLCIITVLVLNACQTKPLDYALLSGQIENSTDSLRIISLDMTFNKSIGLQADGSFSDTLDTKFGHFYIDIGSKPIPFYLEKGGHLVIKANANDTGNTLTYSGESAGPSNYLLEKKKVDSLIFGNDTKSLFELDEKAYKEKYLKRNNTLEKMLDSMTSIGVGFKQNEKRNLKYEYINFMNWYEPYHASAIKQPDFKVSKEFIGKDTVEDYYNVSDYNFSARYRQLVWNHCYGEAGKLKKVDSLLPMEIAVLKVLNDIPNDTLKNTMAFQFSKRYINMTKDLEDFYDTYQSISTNVENNAAIEEIYNELKTLSKGQPSPKFVGYENHDGGTTSLDDLKGKYVYIDVWATWCAPCKKEIPFLKDVESKYQGKNIAFVSISVDKKKDHDKWKKMVEEKELEGIQLFAGNDFKSKFIADYQIHAIPRFILIDPDGNIVNSSAPRPSEPALVKLFTQLKL